VSAIEAVVFDLDGVLLDSEQAWDDARKDLVAETGGTWTDTATRDMLGMSSREWPVYLRDRLGVDMQPADISADVVARMLAG
jgi:beta-phosphoglucomutase-like phosphatase (HAD superfamily)